MLIKKKSRIFCLKIIIIPQPFVLPETDLGATTHSPLEVINKTVVVLLLEDSL